MSEDLDVWMHSSDWILKSVTLPLSLSQTRPELSNSWRHRFKKNTTLQLALPYDMQVKLPPTSNVLTLPFSVCNNLN